MNTKNDLSSRRRGVARLALVWLLGCLAAGGGLLAAGANHAAAPAAAAGSSARPHTKAIEDVRVGDWVLAKDPGQAGPPTPHRVVALPRNWTEHVAHVRLEGGGELLATRSHPFWAEGRGWVDAADLRAGDRLVDDAGRPAAVAGVEVEERTCDTYNLTVEGVHTYYALAGETPVLVHNVNPWEFGNYDDMIKNSTPYDGLQIHHYPQGQPAGEVIDGYTYSDGLAVAVPDAEHRGMNGTNYKSGEFEGSPEGLIGEARDNMRDHTSIPDKDLDALDAEARRRYLPCE